MGRNPRVPGWQSALAMFEGWGILPQYPQVRRHDRSSLREGLEALGDQFIKEAYKLIFHLGPTSWRRRRLLERRRWDHTMPDSIQ